MENLSRASDRISATTLVLAVLISAAATWSGYWSLGGVVALVFAVGYFGGLLLWLLFPQPVTFHVIKLPYWLTLAAFVVLHKVEENRFEFFERVSSLASLPMPEMVSAPVVLMLAVGFAPWLVIPLLQRRPKSRALGTYLAWTFFASMGMSELAHFLVFPFLVGGDYAYFPGMASVIVLAPAAWWGLWRLARNGNRRSP